MSTPNVKNAAEAIKEVHEPRKVPEGKKEKDKGGTRLPHGKGQRT